jgi:hypothetical protein
VILPTKFTCDKTLKFAWLDIMPGQHRLVTGKIPPRLIGVVLPWRGITAAVEKRIRLRMR